jgi:hypothetical protein
VDAGRQHRVALPRAGLASGEWLRRIVQWSLARRAP